MTQPRVVKVLDLSTAHIPAHLGRDLAETEGVIAHEHGEHGYLLWVPENPVVEALEAHFPAPPEIVNIQLFARNLDCDYVLFDRDGDRIDDLPSWDW